MHFPDALSLLAVVINCNKLSKTDLLKTEIYYSSGNLKFKMHLTELKSRYEYTSVYRPLWRLSERIHCLDPSSFWRLPLTLGSYHLHSQQCMTALVSCPLTLAPLSPLLLIWILVVIVGPPGQLPISCSIYQQS